MVENKALQRIRSELKNHHIVLFMKGTPSSPKCGFSENAAKRLNEAHLEYQSVDILADHDLYDGVRQYTGYTHFPQMFVDGRLIGSNDNIDRYISRKKL